MEELTPDRERRLLVRAGPDGGPVYRYILNGELRPFDASARRWLADRLSAR